MIVGKDFVRILSPNPKVKPGMYSERTDKVRINKSGHPLNGVVLEGGIKVVKSKKFGIVEFTRRGNKGKKGVDVDYLVSIQPDYIKELMVENKG